MNKIAGFMVIMALFIPQLTFAKMSNDPFVDQWGFKDTKVYEAWEKTTGSSDVVVAVIDDGFDTFHSDLYPNVWKNEGEIEGNNIDDDKNGYIDDVWGWDFTARDLNNDGVISDEEEKGNNDPRPWVAGRKNITNDIHHGTLVAGIIGAVGDNNLLGAGINWHVRLMNLKVIENSGEGGLQPLVEAIYYAADNNADVINISLEGDVDVEVKKAIKYAYDKGVAVIAAAGNGRVALDFSQVYPVCADASENEQWVLGVSAIKKDHYLANFSNVGATCIDITAPGESVSSTMRYAPRQGLEEIYSGGWQGTSFAAPFVSGAAALVKSIQPTWSPSQIYHAILSTVHRTPPKDVKAYEELYGAGLLQINKAVEYALSQKAGSHPLVGFIDLDLTNGNTQEVSLADNSSKDKNISVLKGVDDVAQYKDGFVAVKQAGKSQSKVFIYNKNWQEQKSFVVSSKGILRVVAGDVLGDEKPEIILAPSYKDKQVFRIFDFDGKELNKLEIANAHRGVNLGLVDGDKKQDILAVYNYNGKVMMYHFDGDLKLVLNTELSFIKNTGQVGAGDIDGDGIQEYIVAGGIGDTPYLAFLNKDGEQLRKFYGYNTDYTGGLSILVGDYDKDGKDDVLVTPKSNDGEAVFWNNRSKKIASWSFTSSGNDKLLPVF